MQNGRFPSKIALRLKKVCYIVSFCENCQQQSCKVFIGLTIHAKMIGGGRPLLPEVLGQSDRIEAKSPIFDLFNSDLFVQRAWITKITFGYLNIDDN